MTANCFADDKKVTIESKYKVMHQGMKNQRFHHRMNNQELSSVEAEKDLGVYITSDLKPSRQFIQPYSEASRALGMIRRTMSKEIILRL